MIRYLHRRSRRALATIFCTSVLLLGFVAPSAAWEGILWAGEFTEDGCKVTLYESSFANPPFSNPIGSSCTKFQARLQHLGADGFKCNIEALRVNGSGKDDS